MLVNKSVLTWADMEPRTQDRATGAGRVATDVERGKRGC